ncbi:60S ribosomal export protein NMD3 [Haloquadratum walsbyi]|uniref:NMD3 family protein n=1 Tax=Haloquadratum walsbyi (strain DSM 16790 / HBSQ001) TaxID=362976 RepID=Q18ET7_HALWD|nr:60S ribosomal export protein NMD3 [Haloquadratum walsbyi]CAJ53532.1 NMD3 family protein [Haloquadratum walsbyi DSM 16790]
MSSGEFCPRCGDVISKQPSSRPGAPHERDAVLCNDCYFADFELIDAPERLEVQVCARCGAVKDGSQWVDVDADDYTEVAIDRITESLGVHLSAEEIQWGVEPEQVDENTIRMHCTFSGVVRGTHQQERITVPVLISRQTCQRCGRIAGGYYASIVQVRARERTPTATEQQRGVEIAESYIADRKATGDRDAFISEITTTDDGTDIKISTNQLGSGVAAQIVRELGGSVSEYPTLVTEDGDGNEVYRVTYAVRLPEFTPGDVIEPADEEGPVVVRSVQGNLKGVRATTGDSYEASFEDGIAPDAEHIGTVDDATETTVVAFEDTYAMQVLDPETYESKTVARPSYVDPDAATVPVIKSHQGLYVLPTSMVKINNETESTDPQ